MQTGVQVLFGFLLTVPFASGFDDVDTFGRATYFLTLLSAGTASALLMAPAAVHRMLFRQRDKLYLVRVGHQLTVAGMFFVALAMTTAVLMVVSVLFGTTVGGVTAGLAALLYTVVWFALPLRRRARLAAGRREP